MTAQSACTTPEGTCYTDSGVVVAYGVVPHRSPVLETCTSTLFQHLPVGDFGLARGYHM